MTDFPFEAETRLIRWNESSAAGRTITLELPPDEGEAHPFRGFPTGHQHGQRFKISFVPIGDDEQPRDPAPQEASPPPPVPASPPQEVSPPPAAGVVNGRAAAARERYHNLSAPEQAMARAGRLPKQEKFRVWAGALNEEDAAQFIRHVIAARRREIVADHNVYARYIQMETSYLMDTGLMPEIR